MTGRPGPSAVDLRQAATRRTAAATTVYDAEDTAAEAFPPRRYRTFAELRAHVDAIVCSDWWADTFPGAPIEVHVQRRSHTATYSAACRADGAGILWFVDGEHWTAAVVCHELAHVASNSGHDDRFRRALLTLWRRECGFLAATELSAQLDLKETIDPVG